LNNRLSTDDLGTVTKKGVGYFTDTGMTVIRPSSTDFKQLQTT